MGIGNTIHYPQTNGGTVVLRKSAINNSLLDLTDASEKMTRRGSVGSLDSGMSISFVQTGATANTGITQSHRHSGDGPANHNGSHHQQQHSVPRVVSNGSNAIHPVVGTCNNCLNPVPLSVGASNHSNTCYHHMHHHHYHHHHHNLHLQQEYQHRHHHTPARTSDVQSSNVGNSSNHSGSTVASITSALL